MRKITLCVLLFISLSNLFKAQTSTFTNDIQLIGIEAPGKVAAVFNTPHTIVAIIKNNSNITNTNVVVSLNVLGANTFANTQTIATIISGAVTNVTFAAFNPTIIGLNTLSVSVPPDQNNANNVSTFNQSVTCNESAINPAAVSYTMGAIGFNNTSGIIGVSHLNPVSSFLSGIRVAISTNISSIGNSFWGVLLSGTGAIIATTNTLSIASASMLGTFQSFTFATPPSLGANTNYYFGIALPANGGGSYFPLGTYTTAYVPYFNYVTAPIAGGTPTTLTSNLGYFGIEGVFVSIGITAPSTTINCGNTAILSASSTAGYTWSTGPVNTSISVSPVINTQYTVSVSNSSGCLTNKTVSVIVNPISIGILSSTNVICSGQSVNFTGTGANSYTWLAGGSGLVASNNFSHSPTSNTTYTLIGANTNGCSNTSMINVTVHQLPSIFIASSNNSICAGANVTLTASGGINYNWSSGANTASIVVSPSASTTYSVIGANTFSCSNSSSRTIIVNSFVPGLISTTNSICLGSQAGLSANGGAANSYTWNNGVTSFNSINVTPTITTSYSVSAYGQSNNCYGKNSTTITVWQNPTVTATAGNTVMCKNEKNILTAQGANTYAWSTSDLTNTIQINPNTATTLSYVVTGTDNNGCSKSFTIGILVNECTGLNHQRSTFKSQLLIYPNPTKNRINIETDIPNLTYSIYNSIGQLVLSKKTEAKLSNVDLSEQAPGIYFIKLFDKENLLATEKIIIE